MAEGKPRAADARPARPSRLSWRALVQARGPAPPAAVAQLGLGLCTAALAEPVADRMLNLTTADLFLTPAHEVFARAEGLGLPLSAPERLRGAPHTPRVDVYLACLALAELLLGAPPFPGGPGMEVLARLMGGRRAPLPRDAPPALAAVLERGLELEPAARFEDLEALRRALEATGLATPHAVTRWLEGVTLDDPALPAPPAAEGPAERLRARIAGGDEGARLALADLLEESGAPTEAAWVRLEHRLHHGAPADRPALVARLDALGVSLDFMASVARSELEACGVEFGLRCPRAWGALSRTDDPLVRRCPACREPVVFVGSVEAARARGDEGLCVALAPHVVEAGQGAPGVGAGVLARRRRVGRRR